MIEPRDVQPGDWVRFYQNGRLVIGVVQYRTENQLSFKTELLTDVGVAYGDEIVEARR